MLANQYFLSRRYKDAIPVYENVLKNDPGNNSVKKKLILCYTENGLINKALHLFHDVVTADIGIITDTDPVRDDCPCPQLIYDFECSITNVKSEKEMEIVLGILWTFCDLERAVNYFGKAASKDADNELLKSIYTTLSSTSYKPKMEEH